MNNQKMIVLKFGGSVLHSPANFVEIGEEICRFSEQGYKVLAVLSAYYGVTEALIAKAEGMNVNSPAYAQLIASGELESSADLVAYLNRSSVTAKLALPAHLEFVASGERRSAAPSSINHEEIITRLRGSDVVVMPGFSAIDSQGECVLLGRGGSDISAVYLAHALKLESVRLLKDVDGLYDRDPNQYANANRFAQVDYATALEIGGALIQAEAIAFAQNRGIDIDIAGIGNDYITRIGAGSALLATELNKSAA